MTPEQIRAAGVVPTIYDEPPNDVFWMLNEAGIPLADQKKAYDVPLDWILAIVDRKRAEWQSRQKQR